MNNDLKKLYRTLGYTGPLTDEPVSFSAMAQPEQDVAEMPPLDAEGLDQLETELKKHPRKTLWRAREVMGKKLTTNELQNIIAETRRALEKPAEVLAEIESSTDAVSFAATVFPPGFDFPGFADSGIEIDVNDRKFENDDLVGLLGWALFAGPFVLTRPDEKNFRYHNQPQYSSNFIYELEEPVPDAPLEFALFSDFGVGRYYSKHIARQIHQRRFSYAVHLGDVYYAGRRSEFRDYFEALLDPILADTSLFSLNSNHEMYSGGIPYFDYITKRAQLHPAKQKQEGSYFCLRSQKFQVIGIDTAFFDHGRYKKDILVEWLRKVLLEGRQTNRINILLSADNPYDYGEKKLERLLRKDLKQIVLEERLVDLWFWGNTHYCALYDHRPTASGDIPVLPFIGSCIGHGGYPYDTYERGKFEPAPIVFLEDQPRFPAWTGMKKDKGNNGYCVMQLKADGSIGLQYIDWMSNLRFQANLSRDQDGKPLKVTPVQ